MGKIKNKKKVVIIGGGFAGIAAAKTFLRLAPGSFDVSLVDKNDYHLFLPALWKAALTESQPSEVFSSVAIPFGDIFRDGGIKFYKREFREVLFDEYKVILTNQVALEYDYLILSMGAGPDFKKIPGAKERAMPLRNFEDAVRIKSAIDDIFRTKPKKENIAILVAGGGLTGVETAGRAAGYVQALAREHGHPASSVSVKLAHSGANILPEAKVTFRNICVKALASSGVVFVLNSRIKEVEKDRVIFENGEFENYDVLVWTVGAEPNDTINGQKLGINAGFGAGIYKNVFMVGDAAASGAAEFFADRGGTAQSAIKQGKFVARKIIRMSNKIFFSAFFGLFFSKYRPARPKVLLSVGNYFAADLGFAVFGGRMARIIKLGAYFTYFLSILPYKKAVEMMRKYDNL
jgi:NADH dehydrogenase